jgi:hypothetical protein
VLQYFDEVEQAISKMHVNPPSRKGEIGPACAKALRFSGSRAAFSDFEVFGRHYTLAHFVQHEIDTKGTGKTDACNWVAATYGKQYGVSTGKQVWSIYTRYAKELHFMGTGSKPVEPPKLGEIRCDPIEVQDLVT